MIKKIIVLLNIGVKRKAAILSPKYHQKYLS